MIGKRDTAQHNDHPDAWRVCAVTTRGQVLCVGLGVRHSPPPGRTSRSGSGPMAVRGRWWSRPVRRRGGGDVGVAVLAVDAYGEVAQAGHDAGQVPPTRMLWRAALNVPVPHMAWPPCASATTRPAPGCRCCTITSFCRSGACARTVSGAQCTPRPCLSRPSPRPRSTTGSCRRPPHRPWLSSRRRAAFRQQFGDHPAGRDERPCGVSPWTACTDMPRIGVMSRSGGFSGHGVRRR